tara:strand:+ start:55 stop:627 length:573 start_codon:yes stop_codon:yes gene_type:complete
MKRLSFNEVASLAVQAGFSPKDAPIIAAISMGESGGNPLAHNPRYPDDSYGLMQINMLDEPGYMLGAERRQKYGITNDDLKDPLTNLRVAKDIWDTQGPNAWSVYKHGIYKDYLPANMSVTEIPDVVAKKFEEAGIADASVGRGRSTSDGRKAGDKLLQMAQLVSSNDRVMRPRGTVLEFSPMGLAALDI